MLDGQLNEQQIPDYQMPTTDLSGGGAIGQSSASDIITATGNIDPNKFWMVVMIILMLGLGGGAVFWIQSLYAEINTLDSRLAKKDVKIEQLEKQLDEAPQKTLDELLQTHQKIQELRGEIKYTDKKIEEGNRELLETNDKLKQIEKGL